MNNNYYNNIWENDIRKVQFYKNIISQFYIYAKAKQTGMFRVKFL